MTRLRAQPKTRHTYLNPPLCTLITTNMLCHLRAKCVLEKAFPKSNFAS